MAEDSGQERTEQATPKRLDDARRKGQIARSRELNTMAMLLLGAVGLIATGPHMVGKMGDIMELGLRVKRSGSMPPWMTFFERWSPSVPKTDTSRWAK